MFEQYEELAKEQYTNFNFDGWECSSVMKTIHGFEEICEEDYDGEDYYYDNKYESFAYKIPNGYVGCVFTNVMVSDNMFFMIDIRGIK
ncbi:hypothetical protein KLEP7_gp163 [Pseudaeromonas phage vB_PpeM_ KLEP7]|nr:hypothetical protein KLEP7_gp163 [Pseudaeromonas phage vB_PpeM_ KLEP7]